MISNLNSVVYKLDKFTKRYNNTVNLKQNDIRKFKIAFYENGEELNIENFNIEVRWVNPNNTVVDKLDIDKTIVKKDNTIEFTLDKECTKVTGIAKMEICLTKNGLIDSSWTIEIPIKASIITENQEVSKNTSNLLDKLNSANTAANNSYTKCDNWSKSHANVDTLITDVNGMKKYNVELLGAKTTDNDSSKYFSESYLIVNDDYKVDKDTLFECVNNKKIEGNGTISWNGWVQQYNGNRLTPKIKVSRIDDYVYTSMKLPTEAPYYMTDDSREPNERRWNPTLIAPHWKNTIRINPIGAIYQVKDTTLPDEFTICIGHMKIWGLKNNYSSSWELIGDTVTCNRSKTNIIKVTLPWSGSTETLIDESKIEKYDDFIRIHLTKNDIGYDTSVLHFFGSPVRADAEDYKALVSAYEVWTEDDNVVDKLVCTGGIDQRREDNKINQAFSTRGYLIKRHGRLVMGHDMEDATYDYLCSIGKNPRSILNLNSLSKNNVDKLTEKPIVLSYSYETYDQFARVFTVKNISSKDSNIIFAGEYDNKPFRFQGVYRSSDSSTKYLALEYPEEGKIFVVVEGPNISLYVKVGNSSDYIFHTLKIDTIQTSNSPKIEIGEDIQFMIDDGYTHPLALKYKDALETSSIPSYAKWLYNPKFENIVLTTTDEINSKIHSTSILNNEKYVFNGYNKALKDLGVPADIDCYWQVENKIMYLKDGDTSVIFLQTWTGVSASEHVMYQRKRSKSTWSNYKKIF